MVATSLTDIAGSSAALERGLVTYSNAAKMELLGVRDTTLTAHGAVSAECAGRDGCRSPVKNTGSDAGGGHHRIAGPGGGTPDKPVGPVHFARQRRGEAAQLPDRGIFTGDRPARRAQATQMHCSSSLSWQVA